MSETGENAPPPPAGDTGNEGVVVVEEAAPLPVAPAGPPALVAIGEEPLPEAASAPEASAPPETPAEPRPPSVPLGRRLSDNAQAMDGALTRLALTLRTWALLPLAIAVCVGEAAWAFHRPAELHKLDTNKLPEIDRIWMSVWVGTAFLALWTLYVVVALVRARGGRGMRFTETVAIVSERLLPLLALPVIPVLAASNIEKDSPKLALFYIAVAAALVGRGVYAWGKSNAAAALPEAGDDDTPLRAPARWPAVLAAAAVAALGVAYGAFFTRLAVTNHHALNSRTTDLGYYDNIFYQSAHGHPLGCSFIKAGYHGSAHFDPILILLSPIYLLYPRAEFLLALQSCWLGAGVVPLYLLAKHKLGRRAPAVALAVVYVLYPALQGANMYEFHSLTLVTPVILWLLYLLETRNFAGYWPVFAIALLTREDISLLLCFVGLYALLSDRARLARTGWVTAGVSLLYFFVVKRLFMTSADIFMSGKDSYSFAYYYDELIPNKTGIGGLLLSLVTNPAFVLKTAFSEPKVVYMLLLFLPLAFLPFLVKPGRVMLVYGFIFTLLASRTAVFSIHFQYSSLLVPVAFALAPMALHRLEDGRAAVFGLDGRRLSRGMLAAALVASALVCWKFGALVDNQSFKGGFARVTRKMTDPQKTTYAWIEETTRQIPGDASVGTTNKLGPHVSNRMEAYFYPEHTAVDYVFIDESELKATDVDKHNRAVKAGQLHQLARSGKMALFRRNQEQPPPPSSTTSVPTGAPDTDPERDRDKDGKKRETD